MRLTAVVTRRLTSQPSLRDCFCKPPCVVEQLHAARLWSVAGAWGVPVSLTHFNPLLTSHTFRLAIAVRLRYVAGSADAKRWGLFARHCKRLSPQIARCPLGPRTFYQKALTAPGQAPSAIIFVQVSAISAGASPVTVRCSQASSSGKNLYDAVKSSGHASVQCRLWPEHSI